MGAHRKPKTKPTAFAAVVTAAIVVPAGTAAAASYGGLHSPASGTSDVSAAGQLAAKTHTAATSAAKTTIRRIAITTRNASTSVSAAVPAAASASPTAKPSTSTPASASASASPSASASASAAAASKAPAATKPSASATTAPSPSKSAATVSAVTPNPYKNVSLASLEPTGLYGAQQYVTLTSGQWANARTIVAVTEQRGMPLYAAVVAMATAMQELQLTNLKYATNYDSLGLFQQRPSMGWGTPSQVTDPVYATNAFLSALTTYAPHYESQTLWVSAQAVQRSGFPTAYAQWEDQAAKIVQAIANGSA